MESGSAINLKEVANRLNVSEKTVERMVQHERFPPPFLIGTTKMWWEKDVECVLWLSSRGMLQGPPLSEGAQKADKPGQTRTGKD